MKMKVVIDGQNYTVEIEDVHNRPIVAKIDGQTYEVWPEDENEAPKVTRSDIPAISVPEPLNTVMPVEKMSADQVENQIQAPLPGVIVAVFVKMGDQVTRGQELCTLEAMKMKNAIKSNREGTIKTVDVIVGDQVNHGQVLITFTD